jgi:molecular chaperone HtpG
MQEGQEFIYYACGDSIETIKKLPQMERLQEKEYEVLYFLDDVDEFAINILQTYKDKKFKSVNQGDLGLDTEEEKKDKEEKAKENESLLTSMKDALSAKVKEVRISSRLKSHPVCLVSEDGISLEMEKVLAQSPMNQGIKASKILEINPNHEIFKTLQKLYEKNPDAVKNYADVLYNQALLIEGLPVEDPIDYANKVCEFMIEANK